MPRSIKYVGISDFRVSKLFLGQEDTNSIQSMTFELLTKSGCRKLWYRQFWHTVYMRVPVGH